MWNSTLLGKFNFFFSAVFSKYQQNFFFWREEYGLGYNYMMFWDFPDLPYFSEILKSLVVWQLVRQHVYTMSITNNYASLYFWWKEKLVKYQKLSKYYVHHCSTNGNCLSPDTSLVNRYIYMCYGSWNLNASLQVSWILICINAYFKSQHIATGLHLICANIFHICFWKFGPGYKYSFNNFDQLSARVDAS